MTYKIKLCVGKSLGTSSSAGISTGMGTAIGGGIQGVASLAAAYLQTKEAKKLREQAKRKHNADTKLQLKQFNMNQDRLAGLAGVTSGQEQFQQGLATSAFDAKYGSDVDSIGADNQSWQQRYDANVTAETDMGANVTSADAYMQSMRNKSIQDANATARTEFTGKGDYKNMNADNYTI